MLPLPLDFISPNGIWALGRPFGCRCQLGPVACHTTFFCAASPSNSISVTFFLTRISLILWGHKSSDLEPKNALTEGKGREMGDSIKTLFSSDFIWSRGGSIGAAIDLGLSWRGDAGSHLLILFIPCQTDLKFTLVFLSKGVSSLGKRG